MTDKKKSTKAAVLKLAKALSVEIEEDFTWYGGSINADAPRGRTFACDPGLHGLVAVWYSGEKPEAWADLINRMSSGVEACELEDCDVCHPEPEAEHVVGDAGDLEWSKSEPEETIERAEATRDRLEDR